jgi:hypothetical protein
MLTYAGACVAGERAYATRHVPLCAAHTSAYVSVFCACVAGVRADATRHVPLYATPAAQAAMAAGACVTYADVC